MEVTPLKNLEKNKNLNWDGFFSGALFILIPIWLITLISITFTANAAEPTSNESPEEVSVEKIKEKYWARGEESELGVVQNRTYSKERKLEASLIGGMITTDPFLTVKTVGASIGFHLSEYLSVHALGWKNYVSASSALDILRSGGKEANTNPPRAYLGAEGLASVLYGKLSLMGQKIIYYDLHFSGGIGVTDTENGRTLSPSVGIGQNIYINKRTSIRFDYRLLAYRETLLEKEITALLGQPVGQRTNFSNSITLAVTFLLDPFASPAAKTETSPERASPPSKPKGAAP